MARWVFYAGTGIDDINLNLSSSISPITFPIGVRNDIHLRLKDGDDDLLDSLWRYVELLQDAFYLA